MNKYLVCGLNDCDYAEPDFMVVDSLKKATETAKEFCLDYFDGFEDFELEEENNGMRFTISNDYDRFYVSEILEVPESEYLLVGHHAYDGVDFELTWHGSFSEVKSKMKELYSECDPDEKFGDYICINQAVVDDGSEWLVWSIIKN